MTRREKKSQPTAENMGQQLEQLDSEGRVPGSHGATGFSGEGDKEAGGQGLLRVKSGALRQDEQGQQLRLLSKRPVSWQPGC